MAKVVKARITLANGVTVEAGISNPDIRVADGDLAAFGWTQPEEDYTGVRLGYVKVSEIVAVTLEGELDRSTGATTGAWTD